MEKTNSKSTTIDSIIWKWSKNNEDKYPIKLRVTYNRARRYYSVIHDAKKLFLSQKEWNSIQDRKKNIRGENKRIRTSIDKFSHEANDALKKVTSNNRPFTFDGFELEFISQESSKGFLQIFEHHLVELRKEGRIGTWKSYKNGYQAFNKFRGGDTQKKGKDLSPIDITPALLNKYEAFLKKNSAARTTIGIYMRSLKVIYNLCVLKNPTLVEFYPFAKKQNDKGKYKIKIGSGKKGEALTIEELSKFIQLETSSDQPEHLSKRLWLFSFYCQGMNFRDIALLRYEDIKGDSIRYIRQKTKETENIEIPIEIPLTDSIREILIELGNADKDPQAFIFDIITPNMTIEEKDATIRQKLKTLNKWLGKLCENNGLPKMTTYWARHTYANLLKHTGVSIEMIRELLGHSDLKTTEAYLRRFDVDQKREVNQNMETIVKRAIATQWKAASN